MKYPINKYKKNIESAASEEVATRDAATFVSYLLNVLPNPDPVLRKSGKRIEVYRDLLGDWEVFSAVELIHAGLQDLEWQLEQGEAEQSAFDDFKERFRQWDINKILSECVDGRNFGYQPFEFMWDNSETGWHINAIVGKPPEWFNFNGDNELQFKSRSNLLGEPVRPYQFSCASHRESYQNPYGEAAASRIFWPVIFKKGGVEFLTKFLEKFGIPWVVGKQPRSTKKPDKEKLLNDLAAMVQDAVAVIPDDSSVDIIGSQGKGVNTDLHMRYIHYFDGAINKVLLSSETAMSVSKEGTDVRGSGSEHAKVSKSVIRAIGNMGETVVNQAIKWEWHFNHEGPAPVFSVSEPAAIQNDRAERDDNLKTQGVAFKKNYYMKHYGLSEDEFELTDPDDSSSLPGFNHRKMGSGRRGGLAHSPRCQCPGCRAGRFQEDPGTVETDRNQRILDEMVETVGGEEADAANQQVMQQLLQPVIDLIETADSMEDVMQQLAGQFPEMDTEQLEQRIESALFLSDIWGRLSAADEEEQEDQEE